MNRPWNALEGGFSGRKFFRQKGGIPSVRALVRRNQDGKRKRPERANRRRYERGIEAHFPPSSEAPGIRSDRFVHRSSFVNRQSFNSLGRSSFGVRSWFARGSSGVRLVVRRSPFVRSSFTRSYAYACVHVCVYVCSARMSRVSRTYIYTGRDCSRRRIYREINGLICHNEKKMKIFSKKYCGLKYYYYICTRKQF